MNGASHTRQGNGSFDGSEGLPPIHRKRKKKGKGSLQTTSAPLSPNSIDLLDRSTSPAIQQPSRISMTTGRMPVTRRATMSDTGQMQDGLVDVKLQLTPALDRCQTTTEISSKSVSFDDSITSQLSNNSNGEYALAPLGCSRDHSNLSWRLPHNNSCSLPAEHLSVVCVTVVC